MTPGCIPGIALSSWAKAISLAFGGMSSGFSYNSSSAAETTIAVFYDTTMSKYVAISTYGKVFTSTDGVTWTYFSIAPTATVNTFTRYTDVVKSSGGTYLFVASSGYTVTTTNFTSWNTSTILRDDVGWKAQTVVSAYSAFWIPTLNLYIIGGYGGLATSTDGLNWTYNGSLITTAWGNSTVYGFAWSGSILLAFGANGNVATSTDAINWTYQSNLKTTTYGTNASYVGIWSGSNFVVAGTGGKVATSPTGVTWTYRSTAITPLSNGQASGLILSGTVLYLTSGGRFASSSDNGATWAAVSNNLGSNSRSGKLWQASTKYFCSGFFGELNYTTTITNGASWVAVSPKQLTSAWGSGGPIAFAQSGGKIYMLTYGGRLMTSTNGVDWTLEYNFAASNSFIGTTNGMAIFNNRIIVQSNAGSSTFYTAQLSNLTSWTLNTISTTGPFAILSDGNKLVEIGSGGTARYTTDGITWGTGTDLSAQGDWGLSAQCYVLAYNGSNKYVGVAQNGAVATSTDGQTWTAQAGLKSTAWGTNRRPDVLYWFNNKFVLISYGVVATSPDGVTWTCTGAFNIPSSWGTWNCTNSYSDGTKIVIINGNGDMAVTTDGTSWDIITPSSGIEYYITGTGVSSTFGCYFNNKGIVANRSNAMLPVATVSQVA